MLCSACEQPVGKCAPGCLYANVTFVDEYISRHSDPTTSNPPIDTEGEPVGGPEKANAIIIDLERNVVVSAMSNLDVQIREILSDHLDRGDPAIGQDRLLDALLRAGKMLQKESAEDTGQTTLTQIDAQENVLLVLRLMVLAHLDQHEEP